MNIMKLTDELLLEPFRAQVEPAQVAYPVTCEERYYDAASALLEDESGIGTHADCNELGQVIQDWIKCKRDNYEPSDRNMGY